MTVDDAVERVLALRNITRTTGMITKRSQNDLLASLPSDVLAEVAVKIQQAERNERDERQSQPGR